MARSDNPAMVWNGAAWVEGSPRIWDGKTWAQPPAARFFDGEAWQAKAPAPAPFPAYAASNAGLFGRADYVGGPLPPVRVSDVVVSVCAATAMPQLVAPSGFIAQAHQLSSGHWIGVATWPYDGRGGDVVWQVQDSTSATTMNLVYRGGDISSTPVAPVQEVRQYDGVNRLPLNSAGGFTTVFLVLAESVDLTGYAWPDGVVPRAEQLGDFGSLDVSLLAADTPGTGSSAGDLVLDTTVASAACLSIQVRGMDDGRPTWILGDTTASVLGTTTVLG